MGTKDFIDYTYHPCNGTDSSSIPCGSQMTTLNNFSLGVANEWKLKGDYFLRVVPTYSAKGFAVNYNQSFAFPGEPFIATSTEVQLFYLDVPMLLGYQLHSARLVRFNILGGPVPGMRLWQKENSRYAWGVQSKSDVLGLSYANWLFAMHGQAGIEYRIDPFMVIEAGAWARWYANPVLPDVTAPNPLTYGVSLTLMVSFPDREEEVSYPSALF